MADTIVCPTCHAKIEVTEALSVQLRAQLKREFDTETRRREEVLQAREGSLQDLEVALTREKASIDREMQVKLAAERARLSGEAMAKAREAVVLELRAKDQELAEARKKNETAQEAELDLRRRTRQLEDEKQSFDLTLARKMDEERDKIREAAKKEAAEERGLKEAEKDKMIDDLRKQIADWQRKAEQGSQQMQGEVMEIELEDLLRRQFPYDEILPVPKGRHGGDVLQHVHDGSGALCGTIIWESKRTRAWSNGWLPKLRDDQRTAKAQLAVLVSLEMPKGLTTFGCVEGVWVTSRTCLAGLASALRAGLIEVTAAKRSTEGQQDKMAILYSYLSGPDFRHRVQGIVEAFMTLRQDLEREKTAIQKLWAKREKQLDLAAANTAGLHGDLRGIIGAGLLQIEAIELPFLTDGPRAEPTVPTIAEDPDG